MVNRDDVEVILVDNGSTDDSEDVLAGHLPDYFFAITVKVVDFTLSGVRPGGPLSRRRDWQ